MEHIKAHVMRLTNIMQEVLSYLELEEYGKAYHSTKEAVQILHLIAKALSGYSTQAEAQTDTKRRA